jgi:hypothetical protein
MPNLQAFRWYRDGAANVGSVPRYRIEGQVEDVDPNTGLYIITHNFTGANRLTFPGALGAYTEAQRSGLVDLIARYMIETASGGALER